MKRRYRRAATSLFVLPICALGFALDGFARDAVSPNREIFVVSVDGTGPRNLTRNPAQDDYPALSPDGRTLVFRRGYASVWGMTRYGKRPHSLIRLTTGLDRPAWSRDGRRIAFGLGDQKVGVIGSAGEGLRSIANAADPSWGRGRRLAFRTTFGPGFREGPKEIAVANEDGGDRRVVVRAVDLGPTADKLGRPVWSPTAAHIAFSAYVSPRFPLYVLDVDRRSAPRMIAEDGYDPTWSPDGRRLAFKNSDGLWIVRVDGTGLRRLSRIRGSNSPRLPSWSPDGTRIAYVTRPLAKINLVVVNVRNGSNQIVARGVESRQPVWSRDGRKIYFVAFAR